MEMKALADYFANILLTANVIFHITHSLVFSQNSLIDMKRLGTAMMKGQVFVHSFENLLL